MSPTRFARPHAHVETVREARGWQNVCERECAPPRRVPFVTRFELLKRRYSLERVSPELPRIYGNRALLFKRIPLCAAREHCDRRHVIWLCHEIRCLLYAERVRERLQCFGLVPLRDIYLNLRADATGDTHLEWAVAMERFQGDLDSCPLLQAEASAEQVCACVAQLLLLLRQLAAYGLCNNDAYGRNIVWRATTHDHVRYWLNGECRYTVPTYGYQLALIDFGIATIGSKHSPNIRQHESKATHPSAEHVYTVKSFPRYARDLSACLHAVAAHASTEWLSAVNSELIASLASTENLRTLNGEFIAGVLSPSRAYTLSKAQHLTAFTERVLSNSFLTKHAVSGDLFDPKATTTENPWYCELAPRQEAHNVGHMQQAKREFALYCRTALRCLELC